MGAESPQGLRLLSLRKRTQMSAYEHFRFVGKFGI